MVTEIKKGGEVFYKCDVCGLIYRKKETAEKCQNWCETHEGSCNLEYIQRSVKFKE